MRVIFMGAPPFAVPALEAVAAMGAEIVAVYTKAPKPAGRRGLTLTKTAVHVKADELGVTVLTPTTLRDSTALETFRKFEPDVAIVAAYGLILPQSTLDVPKFGCVNLHGSLLPRWRGAAPIQRAIMAGDSETGVDLMKMEAGLDTGPVADEMRVPIDPADTAGDLTVRLALAAAELLRRRWSDLAAGRLEFRPQPAEGLSYAAKIDKAETPIDWSADATQVRNHIHALSPAPGAYSLIGPGDAAERIKLLRVETVDAEGAPGSILSEDLVIACGKGAIRARLVQRAGKGPTSGVDIMRGGRPRVGDRFLSRDEVLAARV